MSLSSLIISGTNLDGKSSSCQRGHEVNLEVMFSLVGGPRKLIWPCLVLWRNRISCKIHRDFDKQAGFSWLLDKLSPKEELWALAPPLTQTSTNYSFL